MSCVPLRDFLDTLRLAGIAVGLREYQDAARLVERLGRNSETKLSNLRTGLAALIGRTPAEVVHIEALFDQHFVMELQVEDCGTGISASPDGSELVEKPSKRRQATFISWVVLTTFIAALAVYWLTPRQASTSPDLGVLPVDAGVPLLPEPPLPAPIRVPPELPVAPRIIHWAPLAGTLLGLPLVFWGLLYGWRRRRELRQWAQQLRRRQLGQLPGPAEPRWPVNERLQPPLTRFELDDMATVLGRMNGGQGPQLDVVRTVRATAQMGSIPTLFYRLQRQSQPIWMLVDVSHDMRLWKRKADALVSGLQQRGIALEVRYFDGNASEISIHTDAPTELLKNVLRYTTQTSLVVISTGSDVTSARGELAPWVEELAEFERSVWLNPIADQTLWRPQLLRRRFPMPVLPMTARGLISAAHWLVLKTQSPLLAQEDRLLAQRPVTSEDRQRLKRLLVLAPHAPLELASLLRQEFCADVPEETLLHLTAEAADFSGHALQLRPQRKERLIGELQELDRSLPVKQRTEERVRSFLLSLLQAAEPPVGTLGHLRWQLEYAMQQVYLHDAVNEQIRKATDTLEQLLMGPLFDEVHSRIGQLGLPNQPRPRGAPTLPIAAPVAREIERRLGKLIAQPLGALLSVPSATLHTEEGGTMPAAPRSRPDRFELSVVGFLVVLCAVFAAWSGIGVEQLFHQKVYTIREEPTTAKDRAVLIIETAQSDFYATTTLCSDVACRDVSVSVPLTAGRGRIEVLRRTEHTFYHVRSRLPQGNLGYSDSVRVTRLAPLQPLSRSLIRKQVGSLLLVFSAKKVGRDMGPVEYEVIDAEGVARAGRGGLPVEMAKGVALISIDAAGYRPESLSVTITPEQQLEKTIVLTPIGPHFHRDIISNLSTSPPTTVPVPTGLGDAINRDMASVPDLAVNFPQQAAKNENSANFTPAQVAGRMVKISGCRFKMGSNQSSYPDEKPEHGVYVPSFWIDETEVTVNAYRACVDDDTCTPAATSGKCNYANAEKGQHPINCVTWNQARQFCQWAGKRLPSEAEWELATRGSASREYAWGSDRPEQQLCWRRNEGTCEVKSYPPGKTANGVYDMAGNVWEWTQDEHRGCYEGCNIDFGRVIRGGSWRSEDPTLVRGALRGRESATGYTDDIGLRCAKF